MQHFFDESSSGQRSGVIGRQQGMANRNLTAEELKRANELLDDIRKQLKALTGNDPLLLFA
jgi:hypothetical protein